jgi:hypothetical protein
MGTFRRQAICMAVGTMLAMGWSAPGAAVGPIIGAVTALSGSATVQRDDGGMATALTLNADIHEGDTVHTGPQSRIKLSLRDGSTLSLGADSNIKLDHLQVKPRAGLFYRTLSLLSGYVRAAVARAKGGGSQFTIESPSMVAAVRGTDWIEQFDSGMTQIFVAQGRVRASGTGRYAGDHVLLNAGQGVTFSNTAPHTPVVRWKKPKIDLFIAATRIP